jgi:SlyX protein
MAEPVNPVTTEERFIDLEIKLAQQEDLVEILNRTVYEQARRIDLLEAMLAKLAEHVRDGAHSGPNTLQNERPPHY